MMERALAGYLRNLADRVENGKLCNGQVWERLYSDGPVAGVEYEAGPRNDNEH